VTGRNYVGGLCGYNNYYGTITNCYTTGLVTGNTKLGGLCGFQTGDSAEISNCFWGTETSGMTVGYNLSSSHPGTITNVLGKTITQMQDINTFLTAGWDFVNVWDICDGTNYPRFIWQIIKGDLACPDGVTLVDFAIFSQAWLTSSGQPDYNDHCDLVDDNTINLADLTIFAENFLQGL
jgi:hypothetical protein